MQPDQLIKAFSATVQASLHSLQTLEPILRAEQTALLSRDPELLTGVVRDKVATLQQLEPSVQARDRLQGSAGVCAGIEGGDRLVAMLGQEALARDWAQLTQLAKTIAELNDRNGRLAAQGQHMTREALGILTGRSPNDDTYSGLRRRFGDTASCSFGRA